MCHLPEVDEWISIMMYRSETILPYICHYYGSWRYETVRWFHLMELLIPFGIRYPL